MTSHLVAMGGGGFLMEDTPVLDDFVLSLARRPRPRVCYVPTATGDDASSLVRFYRAFSRRDCISGDLTVQSSGRLVRNPARTSDLRAYVMDQDVIHVSGGNTANMLALWRLHGLDAIFADAWRAGIVLAGVSAGMICWFSASITDSFGGFDPMRDGLGLITGSACAHYDGEAERRAAFHKAIESGLGDGYAADDGAAIHFVDGAVAAVVTSRPRARAYRVELRGGAAVETPL